MKEKLLAIAIGITTSLVFGLWLLIKDIDTVCIILKVALSGFLSYGVYRLVFLGISWLLPQISFVKKWLYGKAYLDGTWIGAYLGASGKPRIFYEKYEQNYNSTLIKGYSFLLDKTPHTNWNNTSFSINLSEKVLFFTYSTKSFTETTSGNGYGQFSIVYDIDKKYPVELQGFSYDLHNRKQIPAIEQKLEDNLSNDKIIEKALAFYAQNKTFLEKQKSNLDL